MNFFEAIVAGFKNYINFSDRASRSEHNYWILFTIMIAIIGFITGWDYTINDYAQFSILDLIFFIPGLSISVRRLHDINKSGWNLFWCFTIIGIIPIIYWTYLKSGDKVDNSYGSDPLRKKSDNV